MAKNLQAGLRQSIKASRKAGVTGAGIFSLAPLDLRFALQKTLDPRVTFTRASTGTFVGSDGLLQSATTNEARFDHNPTTGESLGLLVEEARTNGIRNNTGVGAVAGTPGTLPTNWTVGAAQGLTTDVAGVGTSAGINYIDLRISGTPTGTPYIFSFESIGIAAAAASQTWTESSWLARVSGSETNISGIQLRMRTYTSGNVFIAQSDSANLTITSAFTRQTHNFASLPVLTASIEPAFRILLTAGAAIDITLRIGLPQLEQGAFATSVIPTTTATATRAADVASITGSNFGTTRTNLLLRSEEFDNASWVNLNTTESSNVAVAPNGTSTADKLIENSGAGFKSIDQTLAISALTYTFSIYVKTVERSIVQLLWSGGASTNFANFNLATGTVTAGTYTSATITPAGSDWFRLSITSALAAGNYSGIVSLQTNASATRAASYTGDGTSGIYIWGAQIETGSTATAYILTTTAAVSVFESSWYNQTEGTVYHQGKTPTAVNNFFSIDDSTTGNRITSFMPSATEPYLFVSTAGSTAAYITSSAITAGSLFAQANAYKINDFAISTNGGVVSTDTNGNIPTVNKMIIGANVASDAYINGTIKRLAFWPVRLANPTLQAITQP